MPFFLCKRFLIFFINKCKSLTCAKTFAPVITLALPCDKVDDVEKRISSYTQKIINKNIKESKKKEVKQKKVA
jgi:hypothetical protein